MAECLGHSPDHRATCRIIGTVKYTPTLTYVQGSRLCRVEVVVNGETFSVIGHEDMATAISELAQNDSVTIDGVLTPHHWKPQDGKDRLLATLEATRIEAPCHSQK